MEPTPEEPTSQFPEIVEVFERGDHATAIQKMREVVARRPDDYRAWLHLAEWEAQERHFQQSLEAAQVMAGLAPASAEPLGFIGKAQLELARRTEALETFRKGFELEPEDGYSGYRVFDLELGTRNYTAAEKTLELLEQHMPGARTDSCQVRLQCVYGEKEAALDGLKKLCLVPEQDSEALREAAKGVAGAGWRREVEEIFMQMLDEPGVNPEIGALWVEEFVFRGAWKYRQQLRELDPAQPVGRRAWSAYLNALGEEKMAELARRAVQRHGAALRAESACWGQAGFALATNELYKEAADWMSDWRAHPEAEPWILFNAALAFRQIGKPEEARAIHEEALKHRADHATRLHQIWLAADAAAAGDLAGARAHLATVNGDDLSALHEAAYTLACATVAIGTASQGQKIAAYNENRRTLLGLRYRTSFRTRALQDLARQSVKVMAASANARPYRLGRSGFSGHLRYRPGLAVAIFFSLLFGLIIWLSWYLITQNYIYLPEEQNAATPTPAAASTPFKPLFKPSESP